MWWQTRCTVELHHLPYDYSSDKYAYTSTNTMETHTLIRPHMSHTHRCPLSTGIVMRHDKRYDQTTASTEQIITQNSPHTITNCYSPFSRHTCTYTLFSPAFVSDAQICARWGKDEVNPICLIYIPVTWLKSTVGIRYVSTSQPLVSLLKDTPAS